jgi:orotidine-5'-phosphate decarboxylase
MQKTTHNPIIVALDLESAAAARALVERIGSRVEFYKVGLELFTAAGMDFVRELLSARKRVFLDLKFYDIPETVSRAVARVAESGVDFLTVHAVGSVMRAAAAARAGSNLRLLGVTVLTSFGPEDLDDLDYRGTIAELVSRRANKAMDAGMDGVVASPLEARAVRSIIGPDAVLVTPGVRSAGADKGDQRRVATPEHAVRDGASYVVMGRQITRAADPAAEIDRVLFDLAGAPLPAAK